MTINGWLQIILFLALIFAVTKPMGIFMSHVFNREKTFMDPVLRPLERLLYRVTAVDETREMRWTEYAVAMLLFSVVSMLVLYLMQRIQQWLPFNPQGFAAVPPGLAYHNFASAATGIALAIAFIRGIAQKEKDTIGNFWVDMVRCSLWILLPFCIVGTLLLVSQGVVQNLRPYDKVTPIDSKEQVIAQGPVASQEIIKEWGTNGGGFFNANSAHPFENPTPLT